MVAANFGTVRLTSLRSLFGAAYSKGWKGSPRGCNCWANGGYDPRELS
jgi:hypothetical protein